MTENPSPPIPKNVLLKQAVLAVGLLALFIAVLKWTSGNREVFGEDVHSFPQSDAEAFDLRANEPPPLPPLPVFAESAESRLAAGARGQEIADAKAFDPESDERFQLVVDTDVGNRPSRKLAPRVAAGGHYLRLSNANTWQIWREEIGRLLPVEDSP